MSAESRCSAEHYCCNKEGNARGKQRQADHPTEEETAVWTMSGADAARSRRCHLFPDAQLLVSLRAGTRAAAARRSRRLVGELAPALPAHAFTAGLRGVKLFPGRTRWKAA
ncbi:hypothetical protein Q5P01_004706 [Channa striata]|uniref:Uncharacterized protein n=1 Tax=Channa striata TaxID=64152 RepID=A0AA88T2E8_CHASR|nr:hypothetical protein Q5P01_004706 [Channa striata]